MTHFFSKQGAACAILFAALTAFAPATQAATTSYTDRATWQKAAGGGTGDIFDNLSSGTADRTGLEFSGVFLVPNGNLTTDIDGSSYARALIAGESSRREFDPVTFEETGTITIPATTATITFDSAITALGFDVSPYCNATCTLNTFGLTINVLIDGTTSTSYTLPSVNSPSFVGFVSDTAFTTFTISTTETRGWHGIDNLEAFSEGRVAPMNAVPLPAGFPLMLAGLGAFYWVRRRQA